MLSTIRSVPLKTPLFIFLGSAALGVWASYDLDGALAKFTQLVLAVVIYFVIATWPAKFMEFAVGLVSILTASIAIYFIWTCDWNLYFADLKFINQIGNAWMAVRPLSTGNLPQLHPNIVGGLISAFLPLGLFSIITSYKEGQRAALIAGLIFISLSIFGLLMTSSRAAWLSFAAGLAIWFWWGFSEKTGHRFRIPTMMVFLLPVIFVLLSFSILAIFRFVDLINIGLNVPGNPSVTSRVEIFWNSLHLARDYFFFGGGLAAFPGLYSRYMQVIHVFLFGYAHNLYLDLLIEQGILGLVSILWVSISAIGLTLNALLGKKKLAAPVLAGIIIFLLHGIFDDAFYGMGGTPLLFVLPGFAAGFSYKFEEKKVVTRSRITRLTWIVLAVIIILGSLPISRSYLYSNFAAIQLSKLHLVGWPNQFDGQPIPKVHSSEFSSKLFENALAIYPRNITAMYRMGYLNMGEGDFQSANNYLTEAFYHSPGHRGLRKLLGYDYAWLNKPDQAYVMLSKIPEAAAELNYYQWWWDSEGRDDLVSRAREVLKQIENP